MNEDQKPYVMPKTSLRERTKSIFATVVSFVIVALAFCLFAGLMGALIEGGCRVRL